MALARSTHLPFFFHAPFLTAFVVQWQIRNHWVRGVGHIGSGFLVFERNHTKRVQSCQWRGPQQVPGGRGIDIYLIKHTATYRARGLSFLLFKKKNVKRPFPYKNAKHQLAPHNFKKVFIMKVKRKVKVKIAASEANWKLVGAARFIRTL